MMGRRRVWGHEARSKPDSPYTEGDPGFATLIHLASSGLWETALYEPETRPSGAYMPGAHNKDLTQHHSLWGLHVSLGCGDQ